MKQKAAHRAGERQSDDRIGDVALLVKKKRQIERCDQTDAARQPVHVVEQINRVGQADDPYPVRKASSGAQLKKCSR